MRLRIPSPSTAIASAALFVALGGTSVAAISYARNAGAVDNKSATGQNASLKRAAGKLIAAGDDGRIRAKFLELPAAPTSDANAFGSYVAVADNATGSPVNVAAVDGTGTLTATCADQAGGAGVEDPVTTLTFNNTSGTNVNYAARLGTNAPDILPLPVGTQRSITINGSNTFSIETLTDGTDVRFTGAVRQDGKQTADAKCLVMGTTAVATP